ncbi:MAG: hypothetical protein Kow0090_12240 [Myxococcota bacterium]
MKNRAVKVAFLLFALLCFIALFAAKIYENTVVAKEKEDIIQRQMAEMERERFMPVEVSGAAKPFILPDLEEKTFSLSDFAGKWVLLHFWATWCPGCVFEIPSLVRFSQTAKPENLIIVAVSLDTELGDIKKFWSHISKGKPPPFLILFDPDGDVAHSYGTFKLPETYLIDPRGELKAHFIGERNWSSDAAAEFFQKLIK